MSLLNINKLKFFVPNVVKTEIIKEELLKLYLLEQELNKLIDSNIHFDIVLETKINKKIDELGWKYNKLINIMEVLNFSELDKETKELYLWAKAERKKLGLSDNLYNIYEEFIPKDLEFKKINEDISNRLVL